MKSVHRKLASNYSLEVNHNSTPVTKLCYFMKKTRMLKQQARLSLLPGYQLIMNNGKKSNLKVITRVNYNLINLSNDPFIISIQQITSHKITIYRHAV